jgi:delta 1-pyrroline-5-carboxylate dehydrogenase
MERNADDTFGATGGQGTNTGGTGMAGTGPSGGLDYTADQSSTSDATGTSGPTNRVDQAKSTVQDKYSQVKDKARELQSTLADRLDAGAEKLRQRNQNATLAAATGESTTSVATDDRVANVQDSVARGMQKSADWLRNGDLKADIERQVRENPGRTLLIALGVGYILGKAFRNNR